LALLEEVVVFDRRAVSIGPPAVARKDGFATERGNENGKGGKQGNRRKKGESRCEKSTCGITCVANRQRPAGEFVGRAKIVSIT
jgi:hypothetical protein